MKSLNLVSEIIYHRFLLIDMIDIGKKRRIIGILNVKQDVAV